MRGIMGVGTNRLNKYTLGTSNARFGKLSSSTISKSEIKVAIAYDVRNNSKKNLGKCVQMFLLQTELKCCFSKNTDQLRTFFHGS